MRCDQCKHWKKDTTNEEWEAMQSGLKECLAVRERWVIMDEAVEGESYPDDEAGENSYQQRRVGALTKARAYVQDGSQYRAELFTAPDFFCALFTAT